MTVSGRMTITLDDVNSGEENKNAELKAQKKKADMYAILFH